MHLGIDLGGTKIEVAVLNSENQIVYRERVKSPQGKYQDTLLAITALIEKAESEIQTRCTIGIGIPGSLHPDTGRTQNANSTWLIGEDLSSDLQALVERPIAIANDADCFTLSEATDGAASGAKSVFGIILGTGVGGGLYFNGSIEKGPNSIRGEWGHNAMHFSQCDFNIAPTCYCGRQHCIETYLSGPALVRQFNEKAPTQDQAENVQDVVRKARESDGVARDTLTTYFRLLGAALSQVINLVDPEVIVVGGGLSNIEELYEQTPKYIQTYLFADRMRNRLVQAQHGDSSGVRGAAWLGKQCQNQRHQ